MSAFQHRDRIEYCYNETIQEPFDDVTNRMLENTALSNSVPMEFLIPPFLTAIAHFLNKSEICPWGSWTQPSIIYLATVGFTGTNKTAAIDAIRNAISDVESANGICDLQSRVNQCKCQLFIHPIYHFFFNRLPRCYIFSYKSIYP